MVNRFKLGNFVGKSELAVDAVSQITQLKLLVRAEHDVTHTESVWESLGKPRGCCGCEPVSTSSLPGWAPGRCWLDYAAQPAYVEHQTLPHSSPGYMYNTVSQVMATCTTHTQWVKWWLHVQHTHTVSQVMATCTTHTVSQVMATCTTHTVGHG